MVTLGESCETGRALVASPITGHWSLGRFLADERLGDAFFEWI